MLLRSDEDSQGRKKQTTTTKKPRPTFLKESLRQGRSGKPIAFGLWSNLFMQPHSKSQNMVKHNCEGGFA